jgi:hypothetical protein
VQFHATISNPKGRFDPRLPGLPDIDSYAKTDKERKIVDLLRAFQVPRWPRHLPPGTPPELVKILRDAMGKTFKDPGFQQDFKKLMGREPTPLRHRSRAKKWRRRSRSCRATPRSSRFIRSWPMAARYHRARASSNSRVLGSGG